MTEVVQTPIQTPQSVEATGAMPYDVAAHQPLPRRPKANLDLTSASADIVAVASSTDQSGEQPAAPTDETPARQTSADVQRHRGRSDSHRGVHRAASALRFVNPAHYARAIQAAAVTRGADPEKLRTRLMPGLAVGAVAVGAVTAGVGAYLAVRHGMEMPFSKPKATGTWFPAPEHGGAPEAQAAGYAPGHDIHMTTQAAPNPADVATAVDSSGSDMRVALAHDPTMGGHASSVSTWSEQTIRDAATHAGLTPEQANALAHDQHNIAQANQGFYGDNSAVANDHDHYVSANEIYNTHGQNQAAQGVVDHWKAEHMPQQPGPPTPELYLAHKTATARLIALTASSMIMCLVPLRSLLNMGLMMAETELAQMMSQMRFFLAPFP